MCSLRLLLYSPLGAHNYWEDFSFQLEFFRFDALSNLMVVKSLENLEKSGNKILVREILENLEKSGNFIERAKKFFF